MKQDRKPTFLAAFADAGTVTTACQIAGVSRQTHYNWLAEDPDYAEAFAEAREQLVESLESEAVRRAREGVAEPVFQGGQQVGTVRKYSDTLLIFLLKANRPDKYRDEVRVVTEDLIDAELRKLTGALRSNDPGVETSPAR